jgi:hypothetical protein
MSSTIKNIIAFVIIALVAALGYFMFIQKDATLLTVSLDDPTTSRLITEARTFIAKRQVLQGLQFDLSILSNPSFLELQSYSTPVPDQPIGKTTIFDSRVPVADGFSE